MGIIVKYRDVEILRKEHVVLKNVSFELKDGEFLYLIGKVGSGKSSLLKSIYSEIPINEGNAKVFDYDLTRIKRKDIPMLRREIGIVFQDFQLLTDRNVYDNLLFVLDATGWKKRADIDERIEKVLKQVQKKFAVKLWKFFFHLLQLPYKNRGQFCNWKILFKIYYTY